MAGEKAEVIKRGAALGKSPEVSLAKVLKEPVKYVGKTVIVTGVAAEICQKKGCWMQVAHKGTEPGVRMTFKDYGFFMPKDAAGMNVRAEGVFEMKVLDKEDAEHLVAEGAKIKLNEDGTANELAFVASGVELSGEKKAPKKAKQSLKERAKMKKPKKESADDEDDDGDADNEEKKNDDDEEDNEDE